MSPENPFSPLLLEEITAKGFKLVRATEVPDFGEQAEKVTQPSWPEFMLWDDVANKHWGKLYDTLTAFQFALELPDGSWVAVGNSIPVYWGVDLETLPDRGWDWALESGVSRKHAANYLCALAIQILPDFRGRGLSSLMVRIMAELGRANQLKALLAPVRPNRKSDHPGVAMEEYITWTQDNKPFDPWLRVHQRLGAKILKVCPQSMRITGTISRWEAWTGMTFSSSGQSIIPGALVPVSIDLEADFGEYIEPNVWLVHPFSKAE